MEKITIRPDGKAFLTLPGTSYKRTRCIGEIHSDTFYTFRNSNHLYQHCNSFGFCHKFIKYSPFNSFTFICVEYNTNKIWTSREALLKNGTFKDYSKNGLEKQIHLTLDKFHNSKELANKELNKIQLETGIKFKNLVSEKFRYLAGAVADIQGGLFNENL
jgi:hypothetical protein